MIYFFCYSDSARHFKVKDSNFHYRLFNTLLQEKRILLYTKIVPIDYAYA